MWPVSDARYSTLEIRFRSKADLDISGNGLRRLRLHSRYQASPHILAGPLLVVDFLECLAMRAAVGLRLTGGGCRGVSPSALAQRLLSIGGREGDFELMDFVPLGVSSPALWYCQKLLQASAGGRLWSVHGGIIPSFDKCNRQHAANHWRPC